MVDTGTLSWCVYHIRRLSTLSDHFVSINALASEYFTLVTTQPDSYILSSLLFDLFGIDEFDFISDTVSYANSIKKEWNNKLIEIKNDCILDDNTAFDLLIDLITHDDYFETTISSTKISLISYNNILLNRHLGEFDHHDNESYEKFHFPLKFTKPINHDLIKISDLPEWIRPCFSDFEYLNPIQSVVFNCAFNTEENLLVSAPTGCGKTNIALMCILQQLKNHNFCKFTSSISINSDCLIVYISPMKALASEIVDKFKILTSLYGVIIKEVTGDYQISKWHLNNVNIMVSTPEKFDIIIRNLSYDDPFFNRLKCVIFDEIHLLNDERGAVLESIVANLLYMMDSLRIYSRLIGMSATLPNWADVGSFLRVPENNLFFFDEKYRPVPLESIFYGIKTLKRHQDISIDESFHELTLIHVIESLTNGYQCMVFVTGRKETITSSRDLISRADLKSLGSILTRSNDSNKYIKPLKKLNPILSELFERGISIHHAGMSKTERKLVENMFRDGSIYVLFCTSTLAWGVNLPAHTVIIKGTMIHSCQRNLTTLELTQIMGRAGRPQYDTSGQAILITEHKNLREYLQWHSKSIPIESKLPLYLENALLGVISNHTITNHNDALRWLSNTFLNIRIHENPLVYGATSKDYSNNINYLINIALNNLKKRHMIKIDDFGFIFPTVLGKIVSKYYLDYETGYDYFKSLNELKHDLDYGILKIFGQSREFNSLAIRNDEIEDLLELSKSLPLYKSEWLNHRFGKVSILLLCYILNILIHGSLIGEINVINDSATRLLKAMFMIANNVCSEEQQNDPECVPPKSKMELALCINKWEVMFKRRMWINNDDILSTKSIILQISNKYDPIKAINIPSQLISDILLNKISKNFRPNELNDISIESLLKYVNNYSHAKALKRALKSLPVFYITIQIQHLKTNMIIISVVGELNHNFSWDDSWNGYREEVNIWTFLNNRFLNFVNANFTDKKRAFNVQIFAELFDSEIEIYVYASCGNWINIFSEIRHKLSGIKICNDNNTPKLHSFDVIRVTDVDPRLGKLHNYSHFNLIQTTVFHDIFHTDDSILICAPPYIGKNLIADLCILNALGKNIRSKVLYLVANNYDGYRKFDEWKTKSKNFLFKVSLINYNFKISKNILESNIIICTPQILDQVIKSQYEHLLNDIRLIIIDQIHLIDHGKGAVLEYNINKLKTLSARIVALSRPIYDAKCLSDWLESNRIYNFPSLSSPVHYKISIKNFPDKSFDTASNIVDDFIFKILYTFSLQNTTFILVKSNSESVLLAQKITNLSIISNISFLNKTIDNLIFNNVYNNIHENKLIETLNQGIAFINSDLSLSDINKVETLFVNEVFFIMVCPIQFARVNMFSSKNIIIKVICGVIKGTKFYDSEYKRYDDDLLLDIIEKNSVVRANNNELETNVFILSEDSKINFIKHTLRYPLPVESILQKRLVDIIVVEISNKRISTKDDFIKFIYTTFFYRRLLKNPLYYMTTDKKFNDSKDTLTHSNCIYKYIDYIFKNSILKLESMDCIQIQSFNGDRLLTKNVVIKKSEVEYSSSHFISNLLGKIVSCSKSTCETAFFLKTKLFEEHQLTLYQLLELFYGSKEIRKSFNKSNQETDIFLCRSKKSTISHSLIWNNSYQKLNNIHYLRTSLIKRDYIIHTSIDIAALTRNLYYVLYIILILQCLLNNSNPSDYFSTINDNKKLDEIKVKIYLSSMDSRELIEPQKTKDSTYVYYINGYSRFNIEILIDAEKWRDKYFYIILGNENSGVIYGFKKINLESCAKVNFHFILNFNVTLKVIISSVFNAAIDREVFSFYTYLVHLDIS